MINDIEQNDQLEQPTQQQDQIISNNQDNTNLQDDNDDHQQEEEEEQKINSKREDLNDFQLNFQISDQQSDNQSSVNQQIEQSSPLRPVKKKRRQTINLMSSEEDILKNINFSEVMDNKQSNSGGEQFILQGLSSQDDDPFKSNQNSVNSKEGSVERQLNKPNQGKMLSEDEIISQKMNVSKSSEGSDIDDLKLSQMRKELQSQLFNKGHSTLFPHQRGKLSVDIRDLDDNDEDNDSDSDSDEEDDDIDDLNQQELGGEKNKLNTWGKLQEFISSTGIYLYNEKKQIQKLLQNLESNYKDNILSNLTFREQFSRRKDYSLESKQYVPIILDTKYQVFRVDNALKINLSVAKDYICDMLKYLQQNPTLFAQVIAQLSSYRDLEINDFIENVNNFLFDNILDSTPTSKPLFKFISEILKKEINNSKKVLDTFKMDSIYMKFIQGYTKRTNFQIFFSDSFKIPLYSIIKLNKIIKIDITKQKRQQSKDINQCIFIINRITHEDINMKQKSSQYSHHHNTHHYHNSQGHSQINSILNSSAGEAQINRNTADTLIKINVSQELDHSTNATSNRQTGFFNSIFSLFTSAEENSLNQNSNDSAMISQPKSVENSVIDETEEDRAYIEERKQRQVDHNIKVLKQITTQIIDSLTKHVSNIPKGIKIMCKMIVILLGERDPSLSLTERLSVLSQFLIMRWVVPSLVSLLHRNTLTELHQIRYQNISIVTKVIQKIFKKEHDNLNDYPGLDKLATFIKGFSERIDQFYDYLLNFDGGFIQEIISKQDAELCIRKEDAITSFCVSFNDVDLLLKIFSSVQDEKIKSQHKKLFAQVEKCIRINNQDRYLDSTIKGQQNTLFYLWKPAEYYTSNLVEKCFKFSINDKNDAEHVNKQKLINVLIQFFQKVNPSEDLIQNSDAQELQGILNFYGRRNKMSQKIMQNGLQIKIQANFIKNLLKRMSGDYENNNFFFLLNEIQEEVKQRKQEVIQQIQYIKYKIQLSVSKLHSQTIKIKQENLDMLERTIKQNILLFIKKADVPVRVIYQDDCQIMIEKEEDDTSFKETYSLYRESLQIECMQQKRIFDKLIDYNAHNIKSFRKQINTYNDYIVEKFLNLPKIQSCDRMAIYEQVQIQFEKYLARALAKKYLLKKEQSNEANSPNQSRKISTTDKTKSDTKKTYDYAHLASLKFEKITKQTNHIDILYIIDECVDQLRDIAELNGQNKNEELIIVEKMITLIEKAKIQECQTIIKIVDSLININFWNKKVKIIQSFTIFKHAANEITTI